MKMVGVSKLSSNLRVTLPKEAADVIGAKIGDFVLFYIDDNGNLMMKKG
jgi:bifunctional DNA-binding transcriptional regulator/antitoxin component of YhaV-PrlF toxin-antitoxin module